jgi:hypothetical protein
LHLITEILIGSKITISGKKGRTRSALKIASLQEGRFLPDGLYPKGVGNLHADHVFRKMYLFPSNREIVPLWAYTMQAQKRLLAVTFVLQCESCVYYLYYDAIALVSLIRIACGLIPYEIHGLECL